MRSRSVIGFTLLILLVSAGPTKASDSPVIAVASGMQFAIREIAQSFKQDTSIELRITLGASGKLFRQIENNAPFELFISADDSLVEKLEQTQRAHGVIIARGRLAVFATDSAPMQVDATLHGLAAALDANQITKFAIANPAHAPYGQRAKEAMAGVLLAISVLAISITFLLTRKPFIRIRA